MIKIRIYKMKIIEMENGTRIGIFEDSTLGERRGKQYYNVVVDKPEWKYGKTVATRCTMQKAMAIAESYK